MMRRNTGAALAAGAAALLAACEEPTSELVLIEDADAIYESPPPAPPDVVITELSAADVPEAVRAAAMAASPEMTILGAEKKVREGRVYFDVEGELPDGSEIELDMLETADGVEVVEIQRDLDWGDVPAMARDAAVAVKADVAPVRVIESKQTDGSVIYELFAEGQPGDPAMEVRVMDGAAEVLAERWPH